MTECNEKDVTEWEREERERERLSDICYDEIPNILSSLENTERTVSISRCISDINGKKNITSLYITGILEVRGFQH